ncbi:MAG: hypothetical protein QXU20_02140, partial [Candidatus Woesearchaeota archaeon]
QRLLNKEYNKNSEDEENEIRKLVMGINFDFIIFSDKIFDKLLEIFKSDERFEDKKILRSEQIQIIFDNLKDYIIKFYYPTLISLQIYLNDDKLTVFDFSKIKPISECFLRGVREQVVGLPKEYKESLVYHISKTFEQMLYSDLEDKIRNFIENKFDNTNLREKIIREYENYLSIVVNDDKKFNSDSSESDLFIDRKDEILSDTISSVIVLGIEYRAKILKGLRKFIKSKENSKNEYIEKIVEKIFNRLNKEYLSFVNYEEKEERIVSKDTNKYLKIFKENYFKFYQKDIIHLRRFISHHLSLCLKENNFLTLNELHSLSDGVIAFLRSELLNTYTKTIYEIIKNDEQERKEVLDYVITNNQLLEKILKSKYKPLETISNEFKDHDYKSMIEKNRILPLYQLSIDFLNIVLLSESH